MAVWGLDVQQVRQLSSTMSQKASEIDTVLSQLTTLLNNTQWTGPDSEAFRSSWASDHTTALRRVSDALTQASQAAQQNALAQEQVSGN